MDPWKKLILEWSKELQEYYKQLTKVGYDGTNPDEAEACKEAIAKMLDLSDWSEAHNAFIKNPTSELAFKLAEVTYDYYSSGALTSKTMIKATPEGSDFGDTYTSSGLRLTPQQFSMMNQSKRALLTYRDKIRNMHCDMYTDWLNLINDLNKVVVWLTSQHLIHNYDYWTRYVNLTLKQANKADTSSILRYVEILKTEVLGADTTPQSTLNSETDPIHVLVQMQRWVPTEPCMTLKELFATITMTVKTGSDAELTALAKTNAVRILKIVKTMGNLEHRYRLITDPVYVESLGLKILPKEGLSEKYILATQTIVPIDVKDVKPLIKTLGSEAPHWIVIETLDGINYRFLKPWSNAEVKIPKHWIDLNKMPSLRIRLLNKVVQDAVLQKLSVPLITMQTLTRSESIHEDLFWKNLRARIRKSAASKLPKLGKGISAEKIITEVKKTGYFEVVLTAITAEITIGESQSWWNGLGTVKQQFIKRELALTHATQIGQIRNGLIQTQESNFKELWKTGTWQEGWDQAMEESLARYINRKSSVFIALDSKMTLLRKAFA